MRAPTAGALEVWRAELRAGTRTRTTLDPLWRAACEEAYAVELERVGLEDTAAQHRMNAAGLILAAAARKNKGVAA